MRASEPIAICYNQTSAGMASVRWRVPSQWVPRWRRVPRAENEPIAMITKTHAAPERPTTADGVGSEEQLATIDGWMLFESNGEDGCVPYLTVTTTNIRELWRRWWRLWRSAAHPDVDVFDDDNAGEFFALFDALRRKGVVFHSTFVCRVNDLRPLYTLQSIDPEGPFADNGWAWSWRPRTSVPVDIPQSRVRALPKAMKFLTEEF